MEEKKSNVIRMPVPLDSDMNIFDFIMSTHMVNLMATYGEEHVRRWIKDNLELRELEVKIDAAS